ncbi:chaperone protein dnaJ 72 [Ipomoea triloba]|uniref:chaperone protein dnaJ 72 n=1 Tax=Ipomoea triloba TaxID=35885 RepID=UPI00125E2A87|nr:chaperone protein dnaJ 72 [Ipomoea triloba]
MDHYKALGVSREASKEAIKQAFRKLAVEFHPDKHVNSPPHVRERATSKFKQLSHAYDTLMDDRKRADYNIRSSTSSPYGNNYSRSYYQYQSSSYGNSRGNGSNYGYTYSRHASDGMVTKMEMLLRFMTTRTFLLNVALAGFLLGASVAIDAGGEALWKVQNSGKSFEEAMESIEKAKGFDDKQ